MILVNSRLYWYNDMRDFAFRLMIEPNPNQNLYNWLLTNFIRAEYKWQEHIYMSSKKNASKSNNGFQVTFVNYRLTQDDKKQFEAWKKSHGDKLEHVVLEAHKDFVKQSSSFDQDNKCWIVSWTGTDDNAYNAKRCITSRAPSFWDAMCMNAFKAEVIFSGEIWDNGIEGNSWG